ncbi:hypothetical protein RRG08_020192 [Elysia crispata]|uniref:Uncharacterized protein n=1 Tax=Elysia crispata TaxID=231223 RepID=A0AAE1A401_9GAST|nr:hypothetical protein RRG08_020192 [Elysia crispata]
MTGFSASSPPVEPPGVMIFSILRVQRVHLSVFDHRIQQISRHTRRRTDHEANEHLYLVIIPPLEYYTIVRTTDYLQKFARERSKTSGQSGPPWPRMVVGLESRPGYLKVKLDVHSLSLLSCWSFAIFTPGWV